MLFVNNNVTFYLYQLQNTVNMCIKQLVFHIDKQNCINIFRIKVDVGQINIMLILRINGLTYRLIVKFWKKILITP